MRYLILVEHLKTMANSPTETPAGTVKFPWTIKYIEYQQLET